MVFLVEKVALVTGGASGIGLSLVQQLLENGVKGIGIADISEENGLKVVTSLQQQFKDKVLFVKTNVTVQSEFEDAFEKTINKFKQLDIVVNNAGILNELQWEKTIAVNLESVIRGTYLAIDKYLPKFKSSEEGVIVNIASILGIDTMETIPTYCAAKHGIIGLGKSLGTENSFRKNKIRVLTVCPGVILTPLITNTSAVKDVEATKKELLNISKKASSPDYVGNSIVKLINEGKHGSVWVLEDEETPYEVTFPHRINLRK